MILNSVAGQLGSKFVADQNEEKMSLNISNKISIHPILTTKINGLSFTVFNFFILLKVKNLLFL